MTNERMVPRASRAAILTEYVTIRCEQLAYRVPWGGQRLDNFSWRPADALAKLSDPVDAIWAIFGAVATSRKRQCSVWCCTPGHRTLPDRYETKSYPSTGVVTRRKRVNGRALHWKLPVGRAVQALRPH